MARTERTALLDGIEGANPRNRACPRRAGGQRRASQRTGRVQGCQTRVVCWIAPVIVERATFSLQRPFRGAWLALARFHDDGAVGRVRAIEHARRGATVYLHRFEIERADVV